jgi:cobalt/nickel transport system permease protein
LHHVVLERWSRGTSALHRRDPRVKAVATLVFLVVLATAHRQLPWLAAACFVLLCAAVLAARLPLGAAVLRAGIVLSFTAVFAAVSWISGDSARAVSLLLKSYLSALTVLLLVSTTRLSVLLHGMERLGAPRFLLMVAQFLYRYLFVISEEAQHMRAAALARGSGAGRINRRARLQAAGGAVAALFARSYGRAEEIHRAMLARGFAGEFRTLEPLRLRGADVWFGVAAVLAPILVRIAIERST